MNTLNYWLGKLNRLQLFGHGVKELVVYNKDTQTTYRVVDTYMVGDKAHIVIGG